MTAATIRARDESDLVILELVRLTLAESWTLPDAVTRLLAKRPSLGALRVAQSRVLRARAEHGGPIADRAALTVAAALAERVGSADSVGDRSGSR